MDEGAAGEDLIETGLAGAGDGRRIDVGNEADDLAFLCGSPLSGGFDGTRQIQVHKK